jgi:hypothetical protein
MSQMLCFPEEVRVMETKSTKPSKVWKLLKQIIYVFHLAAAGLGKHGTLDR